MADPISPDDLCGVCDTTRENHGDKAHEFNLDGVLIPKKAPEPPRQMPPTPRGMALAADPVVRLQLRLVERLVAKKLLNGEDMLYIFGGENAPTGGNSAPAAEANHPE